MFSLNSIEDTFSNQKGYTITQLNTNLGYFRIGYNTYVKLQQIMNTSYQMPNHQMLVLKLIIYFRNNELGDEITYRCPPGKKLDIPLPW